MQSEQINELAEALAKAQGKIKNALKSADNPFFKSKYADLAAILDTCKSELSGQEIAIVQSPMVAEGGLMVLETTLMHKSGQWIKGIYPIMPTKQDPQGYGSAITYARRYSLAAMVGIAQEDDDGNAASQPGLSVKIPPAQQKEFITQVRSCLSDGDEQGLKELWAEWDADEKVVLWKHFTSAERTTMKELMK